MGSPIFSFPFRLTPAGTVATVDQGSDQANAEQIAVLCATISGERPMVAGYGIPDPAFTGIRAGTVAAQIAAWGPQVTVASVTSTAVSATETDVTVLFT
jgi:hypothetical protein